MDSSTPAADPPGLRRSPRLQANGSSAAADPLQLGARVTRAKRAAQREELQASRKKLRAADRENVPSIANDGECETVDDSATVDESASEADQESASDEDVQVRGEKRPRTSRADPAFLQDSLVRVQPPEKIHKSWKDWEMYLEAYELKTFQVLPIFETLNVKNRNARMSKTDRAKRGEVVYIPDEWVYYSKVHICTHGWPLRDQRKHDADKGRPFQRVRATNCPFRFVVQVFRRDGNWQLEVCRGLFVHNHEVSASVFQAYPVARGIDCAVVDSQASLMVDLGTKASQLYDFILRSGENVVKKDVENYIQRHRSVGGDNDDEATAISVSKFAAKTKGNVVTVDENVRGETGVISLSSKFMRDMYSRFPELLLIDSTHKTNRYNYQLLTLMVMDECGNGQCVQHSIVETNGDWHMHRALQHFKRANPDRWKLLRVIVVDKDVNEVRVLQKHFPEARVLICHFHVVKYLNLMARKPEFGKCSHDDLVGVDALVHRLVYATTAEQFDIEREALRGLCDRVGCTDFYAYMEKNWFNCADMWALYRRMKLPHFRNHTNNRLESFFGKFKSSVSPSSSMSKTVDALVAASRRAEKEYVHNGRPGQ